MWEATNPEKRKKTGISFISLPTAQAQKVDPVRTEPETTPNVHTTPPEVSANPGNLLSLHMKDPDSERFTDSELEVLQDLARRRIEIEKKEKELELKMAMISAAEMQIDGKVQKLKGLEESIKNLVGEYDKQEKTQMESLVSIYSNMKPKDAARIFNDLEMDILIKLFSQMKDAKAAAILSVMDSAKANALTIELANKNRPEFLKK